MKFSANLGFLWADQPLEEAVALAAAAGFDAVEFHWPHETHPETPAETLNEVISANRITALSVNTARGQVGGNAGRFGLCAIPGAEDEARSALYEAMDYAARLGATGIHAMAGITDDAAAGAVFERFLIEAAPAAGERGLDLLIEPINTHDVPGYFLTSPEQAADLIAASASPSVRIPSVRIPSVRIPSVRIPSVRMMYDCYHAGRMGRDIQADLTRFMPVIGHIQIAAVPDRGEPDEGEVDYPAILRHLEDLGYDGFIGAEYRPRQSTGDGLGWLEAFRKNIRKRI